MFCLMSFMADNETMTKENGTYIVNTTTLGKDIEGYNGPTPLKVYIKKNKVEKWNGLKVKDAKTHQVDAVTGATYSSEAVIKNVQLALDYYQSHK